MPGAAGGPKQCLKPKSPGFTVMALHLLMFNLQLDELEEQALALHN